MIYGELATLTHYFTRVAACFKSNRYLRRVIPAFCMENYNIRTVLEGGFHGRDCNLERRNELRRQGGRF